MPNTDVPPPSDALLAERYGFPTITGDRARFIAALHALINWLIERPDLPVPGMIELRHHPLVEGGRLTKADLVSLADALGGEVDSSGEITWMRATILNRGDVGARVDYVAFEGDRDEPRRRRW